MSRPRAFLRILLLVSLTLVCYMALLLILPLRRLAPHWRTRLRNRVFRTWSRGFGRIVGMRVALRGTPPIGSFFLVTNHVSYMDIPLLAMFVDAAFVAKVDLRGWPFLGHAFHTAETIFIDRGRKRDVVRVMREIEAAHTRGLGVVVFPEGTSGNGEEILPFKPSLLESAAVRDLPVCWACITYRSPPGWPRARDTICWWGDTPFLPHFLEFVRLPWFEAVLEFGQETFHDPDRKLLAERLRTAMLERFMISG